MSNSKILENYNKNGFTIIRNFYSKNKIVKVKKSILKLTEKKKSKLFFFEKNEKILRRIENIASFSSDAEKIINEKKLSKIIFKILGKNSLFKDKLNFKYPGASGFEPHIDGHFLWKDKNNIIKKGWYEYSTKFVSAVIPLEDTNKKNGCLQIANLDDTHKNLGSSWDDIVKKTYKFTPKIKKNYVKKFNFIPIELRVGDILLFDWKICHASKSNLSKNSRMIFYVTFAKNLKNQNLKRKYYKDKITSKNSISNKSLS